MKVIQNYIDVLDKAIIQIEKISTDQIKLTDKEFERMDDYIGKMGNSSKLLDESANKVIEEATKIKTQDIG